MINWIEIRGNFSSTDGNNINFQPPSQRRRDKLDPDSYATPFSTLKSSIRFENGSIQFSFTVKEPSAIITLKIGDLFIGTNGRVTNYLYSIRRGSLQRTNAKLTQGAGTKNTLKVGKEYKFQAVLIGSNVSLYIDDVGVIEGNYSIGNEQIQITLCSNDEILISSFSVRPKKPKAFVVMQFSNDYNELYNDVIRPVCEKYDFEVLRADEFLHSSLILNDIIESIKESSVIIAEITPDNPNVFYELGYSHALGKPTILLADKKREKLPFDISGFRTLFYDNTIGGKARVEERLRMHLENLKDNKWSTTI